ncbi:hypothetical protein FYK55_13800 [Roseiconus nitratireducens]|uniref:ElaB/YqjD/DUF883 family membrane-anchored ribosome-binding protein n=1 Tax=Roseiconus nitratireducens TaxID=2605748 RepID=A0A5M6DBS5_9BACT|nr:hypothetical protein [Roseiconus nitratireducens]KAA5542605.1 hypothetical protein FYK55_13800 [Roseiconus nitratireducens]
MSTTTTTKSEAAWDQVHEAILHRWPQIQRGELLRCENNVSDLVDHVSQRVSAKRDEVEAVVREFAPADADSLSERARRQAEHAGESLRAAYQQTSEVIAERPGESVLTSFVAGIVVGAAVTALFMSSRREPEPTTWQRLRDSYYR